MSEQCKEMVYARDTYRYSGRGPGGFEMHYRHQQCKRPSFKDGRCWQHQPGYLKDMTMRRWQRKLDWLAERSTATAETPD